MTEYAKFANRDSRVAFDTARVMEGGMKRVFFTSDGSGVVAFFKNPEWAKANLVRLKNVVEDYNLTAVSKDHADHWRNHFCWPSDLVTHPKYGHGLLLPVYPQDFFFRTGRLAGQEKDGGWYNNPTFRYNWIEPSERGHLATYLVALSRIARAVQKMHASGLAHSDLSEKNILIDPVSTKAIIIDVDTLVVTGVHPPEVLGTPGFIAPEVMATKGLAFNDPSRKHACAETDKYALAVLIYRYLLERHPLEGRRIIPELASEGELENEALFGKHALYSEHRSNDANRPNGKYYPASILGKKIEDMFHRTFVEGLLTPAARPNADDWANALSAAFDNLVACTNPHCTHKWFVFRPTDAPTCPYCSTRYVGQFSQMGLWYVGGNTQSQVGNVVLNGFRQGTGTRLFRHHTIRNAKRGPEQENKVLAEVVFLDQPQPTFYLKNVDLPNMQWRLAGGGEYQLVRVGHKVKLVTGLEVKFSNETDALVGRVETFVH